MACMLNLADVFDALYSVVNGGQTLSVRRAFVNARILHKTIRKLFVSTDVLETIGFMGDWGLGIGEND